MVVMVMDVGHIVVVMMHHFRILKYLYFLLFLAIRTLPHAYVEVLNKLLISLFGLPR